MRELVSAPIERLQASVYRVNSQHRSHPAAADSDADADSDAATEHSPELDAIREAFPTLRWTSITRTEEGWDHVVVICHGCSGDDALGHSDLVFRFPTDEQALGQLPNEMAILEYLAPRVEAALPRYTHVPGRTPASEDDDVIPFAGYPMVRGDRLTPELLHSLPFTEQTAVAAQLGALLSTLHITDTTVPPMDRVSPSYQPENLDFVRGIMENNMPDGPRDLRRVGRAAIHPATEGFPALRHLLPAPVLGARQYQRQRRCHRTQRQRRWQAGPDRFHRHVPRRPGHRFR